MFNSLQISTEVKVSFLATSNWERSGPPPPFCSATRTNYVEVWWRFSRWRRIWSTRALCYGGASFRGSSWSWYNHVPMTNLWWTCSCFYCVLLTVFVSRCCSSMFTADRLLSALGKTSGSSGMTDGSRLSTIHHVCSHSWPQVGASMTINLRAVVATLA